MADVYVVDISWQSGFSTPVHYTHIFLTHGSTIYQGYQDVSRGIQTIHMQTSCEYLVSRLIREIPTNLVAVR